MTDERYEPSGTGDPDEPTSGTDQNGGVMREIVDGPVGSASLRLPPDLGEPTGDDADAPIAFEPPAPSDDD